jgi:hypothetical protein
VTEPRGLACAVAAADLHGRPAPPLPRTVDGDADAVLQAARRYGLAGLLDVHVAAGRIEGPSDWGELVEAAAIDEARRCTSLDLAAGTASAALVGAGIDHRLLKGAAVAHLDEADPVHRSYSDVDLLVRTDDLAGVVATLGAIGYRRDLPERRPGFDALGKDVTLLGAAASIDVHRTLVLGPFGGRIGGDELWRAADSVDLAGTVVPTLDGAARFVHACATAVLADPEPKLTALRDVALLSRRPLDLERIGVLAPPGAGAAVLALAVERCRSELGDVVGEAGLAAAAPGRAPSRWERVALRCYRATGGSNTTELLGVAAGLPGWRERARYLAGLALPSAAYRAARRAQGRPSEWTGGVRELVGRTGRHHLG